MTSEALISSLRRFLDDLNGQEMERKVLRASFDLVAAVSDRVQNSGTNRNDQPFAPYTPAYAKRRQKAGFQIRKVDYTRTGRLWGSITPEVVQNRDGVVVVEVAPRGTDNEVKLLGRGAVNPRKDGVSRGLITLPSDQELEEVFADLANEILDDFLRTIQ